MVLKQQLPRVLRPPRQSFFLFGPRGTGKSTWVKQSFPGAHRLDLLDEGLYQELAARPQAFADRLRELRPRSWVCVDEVQRLPQLLNDVHRLIEDRSLRFVLSGSSARKLRRAGVNLLAGRALTKHLYPLTPTELERAFSLESALRVGTMPLVLASTQPEETLRAYVQTYLREEIQAEAVVRNLPGFFRFLPVAATFHGQVINVSAVARDSGVTRTTVDDYLTILDDTLLTWRLPGFEAKLRVRERKHPKLYWLDAGIVRAAKKQLGPVALEERGALFEGWVATLLRAWDQYRGLFDDLSYWAPTEGPQAEVDFLLRRGHRFIAVEAKSSSRLRPDDLKGLLAIEPLKGLERRILVYPDTATLKTKEGIEVMGFDAFNKLIERGL